MCEETFKISCPVCKSRIKLDISADVNFSVDCKIDESRSCLPHRDKDQSVQSYKPDLPITSWFSEFFSVCDHTKKEIGLSDGKVCLFRQELPHCFHRSNSEPVITDEEKALLFKAVPSDYTEYRPQTVYGKIRVQMVDLVGQPLKALHLARPAVDLAYWLCPEVKFFAAEKPSALFYMLSPGGSIFMLASGMHVSGWEGPK